MIDAARYQQAKAIFFAACDHHLPARDAFIESSCGDDDELRAAVRELLAHDANPLSLNESSQWRAHLEALVSASGADGADGSVGASSNATAPGHLAHERVGDYRVVAKLGEGGMGVVYRAEQDNPRRHVALKVMPPGPISEAALRRFQHEAQVLGRLHHPGIAQIFEAGTDDRGRGRQPYIAMELVPGRPLLKYCEETRLTRRDRLELFVAIGEAVEHAHRQGVIHRDLKPANILIDESAQPPRPKVLDFGVARLSAVGGDAPITTMHTRADQLIGTVAYMSPEQLAGRVNDLDARSDVFSLGVILFELLAGRLPHELAGKTMPETIRIVGQEEPTMLGTLNRECRGDLDTIVAKAMERDRTRRYASAGDLAADLRRHLSDEPILARPPSALYQLNKFARRNKTLVGGVAAVFVALVLGIVATAWQARNAIQARDQQTALRHEADASAALAQRAAVKALTVNEFVRRMLSSAEPQVTQGREVSVREVLDSAAAEINGGSLASQPEVQAQVDLIIGETYLALGRTAEARHHLKRSLDTSRTVHGEPSTEVATALVGIGSVHNAEGDYATAASFARQALGMFRQRHSGDHDEIANAMSNLASYLSYLHEKDEALSLKRESLAMLRRMHGDGSVAVADATAAVAAMLHNSAEAEPLLRASLATYRAELGERSPKHIHAMGTLAGILMMRSDLAEAETMLRQTLELARHTYGPDHAYNLAMLQNLSFCLDMAQDVEGSVAVLDEAVGMAERLYGEDSQRMVDTLVDRADGLNRSARHAEAETDRRRAIEICTRLGAGDDHLACICRLGIASEIVRSVGEGQPRDVQEAVALIEQVLAIEATNEPIRRWTRGVGESLLGEIALQRSDFALAEQSLLQAFKTIGPSKLAVNHRRTVASRLISVYQAWDRAEPKLGKGSQVDLWEATLAELSPPVSAPLATPN